MESADDNHDKIGYWSVVALGIGGMVGGGIFAVLGLAVELSGGGTPAAFAVAGVVALFTAYSYSRLSLTYPSQGGTVEFLNRAFGAGSITGGLNILLWLSYVIMLSLYAHAFGSYGASFFEESARLLWKHLLITGAIVVFTVLNVLGAAAVGKAENWIVGLKIAILGFFVIAGSMSIDAARISLSTWAHPLRLVAGGMIIFLAYEGFELIANAAKDVNNGEKVLPKAYFTAVSFVLLLYVAVATVTVGNLATAKVVAARDYALAAAARPFLGETGFILIAIAALLSTGSAINATLYGSARLSYIIAKDGQLPELLEKKVWRKPVEGLLLTSGLTLLAANVLDLSRISVSGSSGFLLIFAAVNTANAVRHKSTSSNPVISYAGAGACVTALVALFCERSRAEPWDLAVLPIMLVVSFGAEVIYRKATGRSIHLGRD